ncbi:hypothetical protein J1605_000677 [Eschrichtius robustus]|uniref:Uncharacterized protein n=1 Tax=Eschrichtius robustus TaxID=9764 RepID=A0AB34GQC5_ESCRO|nr:hypothetical protein J1605_000677 [Eschrichtius robustus]
MAERGPSFLQAKEGDSQCPTPGTARAPKAQITLKPALMRFLDARQCPRGCAHQSEEAIKKQAPEEDAKTRPLRRKRPVLSRRIWGMWEERVPAGSGPRGQGARMPTGAHTLSPSPRIPGASAAQEEQASCAQRWTCRSAEGPANQPEIRTPRGLPLQVDEIPEPF